MEVKVLDLADGAQVEFQIAFVAEPAIESMAMAFNKSKLKYQFKEISKEKRLVMGYFMIADLEIDRYDEKLGRYKVVFPKSSIDKIVENWSFNGLNRNLNENHNTNQFADGVFVMGHFQVDSEIGLLPPKGFAVEPDGSWFGIVKCYNDEIYQKCLDGTYNGFSVESREFVEKFDKVDQLLSELKIHI